jgi:hypothetical protein
MCLNKTDNAGLRSLFFGESSGYSAPRPSTGSGRSEPAELRRRPSMSLRTDSERGVKSSWLKNSLISANSAPLW